MASHWGAVTRPLAATASHPSLARPTKWRAGSGAAELLRHVLHPPRRPALREDMARRLEMHPAPCRPRRLPPAPARPVRRQHRQRRKHPPTVRRSNVDRRRPPGSSRSATTTPLRLPAAHAPHRTLLSGGRQARCAAKPPLPRLVAALPLRLALTQVRCIVPHGEHVVHA